jgi:hypothetical protein
VRKEREDSDIQECVKDSERVERYYRIKQREKERQREQKKRERVREAKERTERRGNTST